VYVCVQGSHALLFLVFIQGILAEVRRLERVQVGNHADAQGAGWAARNVLAFQKLVL